MYLVFPIRQLIEMTWTWLFWQYPLLSGIMNQDEITSSILPKHIQSICTLPIYPWLLPITFLQDEMEIKIDIENDNDIANKETEMEMVTLEKFKEQLVTHEMQEGGTKTTVLDIDTFKTLEIPDTDGGRQANFASLDAGATILDTSSGTKSAGNLLVRDKDRYMLIPREQDKKWIVLSLSEDVRSRFKYYYFRMFIL